MISMYHFMFGYIIFMICIIYFIVRVSMNIQLTLYCKASWAKLKK